MTRPNTDSLQQLIEYQFKNPSILETALTHRSCLNEPGVTESYERLEFLGDAILEMMISVYLFNSHKDKMEGYLTSARSAIVRTESLSEISRENGINQYIKMSKGEESTNGRSNPSILEDVIESIIGALYIDGGLSASQSFFDRFIVPKAKNIIVNNNLKDSKSTLQEVVQSKGLNSPQYKTIKETGPDHDKVFDVAVIINNQQLATGQGKSKQEAEQMAAEKALKLI